MARLGTSSSALCGNEQLRIGTFLFDLSSFFVTRTATMADRLMVID